MLNSEPLRSVLFVGNSLTYRGGGLDHHLERLFPGIRTGRVVKGGATLERLLPLAEGEIAEGGWDAVVFQDDLPETTAEAFAASAEAAVRLAGAAGALPLLLETWPYVRLGWIDAAGIAAAYEEAGRRTGALVVPAGQAWLRAAAQRPETDLMDDDREHPSAAGSWLAACTLAAVLEGEGAAGPARYGSVPDGVDADEASYLAEAAREAAAKQRRGR